MSSKNAGPYTDGASLVADLFKEANEFCASKGLELQPISEHGVDGAPFVRNANANIKFRCLKKGDRGLGRPIVTQEPNIKIENDVREGGDAHPTVNQQPYDKYDELKKLKGLLDSGAITQSEYDAQKKKILGE